MKFTFSLFALLALCFSLLSCSSTPRPLLYPNARVEEVGKVQSEQDVEECLALADQYAQQPGKYSKAALHTGVGSAVGAGTGALAGTIMQGNIGRSLGAGAAVGAIVSLIRELQTVNEPTPSYKQFAQYCLAKKGYEVYGWR